MPVSNMTRQVDAYLRDRALFSSDILAKALKWQTNYTHPLAVAYGAAKERLNQAISEATRRAQARARAYEELKARMDFAVGVLFGLMGPFVDKAFEGLRTSMMVTDSAVDTRVLTQWYGSSRGGTSFDTLLDRARIRQSVLNYVVERGTSTLKERTGAGAMSPAAGATGSVPTPDGSAGTAGRVAALGGGAPIEVGAGEFGAAEFEQNVQNVFNRYAVELHDRYLTIFDGPIETKRAFLVNATKTVLACPPANPITQTISQSVLEAQLFGMISANYMLSFRPTGGMIWPTLGIDLAFTMNRALQATGHSIITNNPRLAVRESFRAGGDEQMAWDGHIEPIAQTNKIRENARGAAAVLEAYMQAIAMSDELT